MRRSTGRTCGDVYASDVWWDATTGIVLVCQRYGYGSCMCGDAQFERLSHVAR